MAVSLVVQQIAAPGPCSINSVASGVCPRSVRPPRPGVWHELRIVPDDDDDAEVWHMDRSCHRAVHRPDGLAEVSWASQGVDALAKWSRQR